MLTMQERVGIIDLGSNTTRLIVMDYEPHHSFKLIDEVRETVRLAEGVGPDGSLYPAAMDRAIGALKMFHNLCRATGVTQIVTAATSALRDASNQDAFVQRLKAEAGMDIRILSGQEEAYYGYLGVVNSLPIDNGFMIDIGGGSTEITEICERQFNRWDSQAVGVVRFSERYVQSDPISNKDYRALRKGAADAFGKIEWLEHSEGRMLVGVGGTVRNLARMDQKRRKYPLERVHGYVLTRKALENIVERLRKSTYSERQSISGLNSDRADVIFAGAVILHQLMRQGNFEQLVVGGQGLREGLFYEQFLADHDPPIFRDVRRFAVRNLGRLSYYDEVHAEKVCALALSLFDQLQPLHGYGSWERDLLESAAMLHDIGLHIGYYDHHKHSAYILLNTPPGGFTHREVAMLAVLVKSHRKGSITTSGYRDVLEDEDEQRAQRLGALLRLSEFLERSKNQVVHDINLKFSADTVHMHLYTNGDATVERWDVERRSRLFEKAFERKLEIEDN
jgi:exopolyphosphatase/guanosine-5'-triphosphate,3'-diphosphate pyrophosphatase